MSISVTNDVHKDGACGLQLSFAMDNKATFQMYGRARTICLHHIVFGIRSTTDHRYETTPVKIRKGREL